MWMKKSWQEHLQVHFYWRMHFCFATETFWIFTRLWKCHASWQMVVYHNVDILFPLTLVSVYAYPSCAFLSIQSCFFWCSNTPVYMSLHTLRSWFCTLSWHPLRTIGATLILAGALFSLFSGVKSNHLVSKLRWFWSIKWPFCWYNGADLLICFSPNCTCFRVLFSVIG